MNNVGIVLVLLLASTCQSAPNKPTVLTTGCIGACSHLKDMKCPEAEPTTKGSTCVEVCENASSDGSPISFQTDCVIQAHSCNDANACQVIQ